VNQVVLVLRWFLDGTRVAQVATDNEIGRSTVLRCWRRKWPGTAISASMAR
jgi:hypothetical protein